MFNFLFGTLCAGGAVFGAVLSFNGVMSETYEAVTAGGIFLFGSLATFGIGQLTRAKSRKQKRAVQAGNWHRAAPPKRAEPAAFPVAACEEPGAPHPVLERVASRFARPLH